jgi:transcriptional regulator with XRE-family HTH domain
MAKSLHTPEYESFRSILVKARQKSGLTQVEVASQLGRPQSFVAKYEGGERRLDLIETLQVCEVLCVDPAELVAELKSGVRK